VDSKTTEEPGALRAVENVIIAEAAPQKEFLLMGVTQDVRIGFARKIE
jgi:hypothetical protein